VEVLLSTSDGNNVIEHIDFNIDFVQFMYFRFLAVVCYKVCK